MSLGLVYIMQHR